MNEVKAFIHKRKAEIVDGLEIEGFCCITLIDVMVLGKVTDRNKAQLSISIAEWFSEIKKLIVVCDEEKTQKTARHDKYAIAICNLYA